ncbi:MAG TPA: hypothetical protein VND65_03045, partial [Candidatus Binatia bacterium]|nr:hypothetical protein [Candidatus Binatia bacterium]
MAKNARSISPATSGRLPLTLACLVFFGLLLVARAHGQYGSLPIGSVTSVTPLTSCPGGGWYSYKSSSGTTYPMNCSTATVTNCSGAQDISLTFGYLNPAAIISTQANGVVVF